VNNTANEYDPDPFGSDGSDGGDEKETKKPISPALPPKPSLGVKIESTKKGTEIVFVVFDFLTRQ